MSLLALPPELVTQIIRHIDSDTLLDMANGICKQLLSFTRVEDEWQARFKATHSSTLPLVESLFQGLWRTTFKLVSAAVKYEGESTAEAAFNATKGLDAALAFVLLPRCVLLSNPLRANLLELVTASSPPTLGQCRPLTASLLSEHIERRQIGLTIFEKYFEKLQMYIKMPENTALPIEKLAPFLIDSCTSSSIGAQKNAATVLKRCIPSFHYFPERWERLNGISVILTMLDSAELRLYGISLISALNSAKSSSSDLARVIPKVVGLLDHADCHVSVLRLFSQLAYDPLLEGEIGKCGGVKKLLPLFSGAGNPEVAILAAKALCNVTVNADNSRLCLEAGGGEAIVAILKDDHAQDYVQASGVGTLLNILSNQVKVTIPEDAVQHLLRPGVSDRVMFCTLTTLCFTNPLDPAVPPAIRRYCTDKTNGFGYTFYPQLFLFLEPTFTNSDDEAYDHLRLMAFWIMSYGQLGELQYGSASWDGLLQKIRKPLHRFLSHPNRTIARVAQAALKKLEIAAKGRESGVGV